MKTFVLSLLLATASALAFGADAPSVAGKWSVHTSIAGNESDMLCTFAVKDNEVTGTCSGQLGDNPITGKVDGAKVAWGIKSEYNGGPLTLNYQGTLDPASGIRGTVTVVEYGVDGDFAATPAKA